MILVPPHGSLGEPGPLPAVLDEDEEDDDDEEEDDGDEAAHGHPQVAPTLRPHLMGRGGEDRGGAGLHAYR